MIYRLKLFKNGSHVNPFNPVLLNGPEMGDEVKQYVGRLWLDFMENYTGKRELRALTESELMRVRVLLAEKLEIDPSSLAWTEFQSSHQVQLFAAYLVAFEPGWSYTVYDDLTFWT